VPPDSSGNGVRIRQHRRRSVLTARTVTEVHSKISFLEISESSSLVFALDSRVSESNPKQVADTAKRQVRAEVGFGEAELEEMSCAAVIPQSWQLRDKASMDIARWYRDEFDKSGSNSIDEPRWYPLGFLGITLSDWKNAGVLLVFYDALHSQASNSDVSVKSFVIDPENIASTLISLCKEDSDYEDLKRHSAIP
jgi:hypothetical protein